MVSAAKLYKPKPVKTAIWILTAALVLAPGEIGVLCYGTAGFATASTCDYAWGNAANGFSSLGLAQYDTTFYFDRDEDLLALYVDGVLVDDLAWSLASVGGATWPRTARYSMRLDDDALDASSNDTPASWCLAASTQVYTATGSSSALEKKARTADKAANKTNATAPRRGCPAMLG